MSCDPVSAFIEVVPLQETDSAVLTGSSHQAVVLQKAHTGEVLIEAVCH